MGPSLNQINFDYLKENNMITFGVNDICKLFTPNYCVYLDNFNDKVEERIEWFKKINSKYIFAPRTDDRKYEFSEWIKIEYEFLRYNADKNKNSSIKDIHSRNKVFVGISSVIAAISISIYMGFKNIGIIGFDFNGDRFLNKGLGNHPLCSNNYIEKIENICKVINEYCKETNINLKNVSNISKINSFEKEDYETWLHQ
jgi:hypothetical protein